MARRLATIAKYINENVKGLSARVEKSWSSTCQKIPGTRMRRPGLGRDGNKLTIFVEGHPKWVLKEHDSSETYRNNQEVEDWLQDWEDPKRKTHYIGWGHVRKTDILSGKYFEDE